MAASLPDVLPMRPYFREMIWGGRRLQEFYGKALPAGKAIGESFEVSACAKRESAVAAGPLADWSLQRLVEEYGDELMGPKVWAHCGGIFPLLIKLIDAQADLSVQVHPDDGYAREKGLGACGKMEAWYVLHSEGGRMVHGLKEGVRQQDFVAAIAAGRVEEVLEFCQVQPGDVVVLPPGSVHALCSGVMLYEVQQPSDLTFRIYDYERPGKDGELRELHLEAALEVIRFGEKAPGPVSWRALPDAQVDRAVLVESEYFQLNFYCPNTDQIRHSAGESFLALTMVRGEAMVRGGQEACYLRPGVTALIPAYREFMLEQRSELGLEYLIASAAF